MDIYYWDLHEPVGALVGMSENRRKLQRKFFRKRTKFDIFFLFINLTL
jgi:hypothetical protein